MKRKGFLAVVGAAALTLVMAACVYEGAGDGYVGVTTLPATIDEVPAGAIVVYPEMGEFLVSRNGDTFVVGTSRTYTNLMTRAGDDYAVARGTEFANVIMEFTFNADGSLASFNTVATGHGADGAATCSRWSDAESATGENVYFFLNRLIAEGVVFPVDIAEVNTAGRATYSRAAVLYAANYAASLR